MKEELEQLKQIFIDSNEADLPIKDLTTPFELIDKIAIQVQAGVKPATCGLCKDCKHFEYSQDYNNVGDCNHPKFSEGIMFNHCDDMYVSEDFGCINFESKLSV